MTNLPESGEIAYTHEEIGEYYRRRWQIELLWKFLKMPLKLARLITKTPKSLGYKFMHFLFVICCFSWLNLPIIWGINC
ncbi:transposase [Microcoleus sp. LEGE 07076]|uniref:transposase n=1 Tax=Microcoleus sp. LEGE 07076 TaxID=915322 RepID=UPI00188292D0|nr:transposase [Microcoleus sp. LEGE 07076]